MGKEPYEMALYETERFIETLKKGIYGDPKAIRHEFWAVTLHAFEEKVGIDSEFITELISKDLTEEINKIFKKLKEDHKEKNRK